MDEKKQFVSGITFYKPNEKAPKWVVCKGKIIKKDLLAWLDTQDDVIRIDVKESKKGTYYADVDTYKPAAKEEVQAMEYADVPVEKSVEKSVDKLEYGEVINAEDIPF